MKRRKIPMRMCVGCREAKPKKELIRVVRDPEGKFTLTKGKSPGRGAYICFNAQCLEKAIKQKSLERALNEKIDPQIFDVLKSELMEQDGS